MSSRVWSFRVDARRTNRPGLMPPDLDVNGDGLADVAWGAYFNDAAGYFAGAACVVHGG